MDRLQGGVVPKPDGFSIGYVSLKTGLSTHVIRAWERRYQAVNPQRTASGRRLFAQSDIDRLSLLRQLLDHGHRISTIAGLERDALVELTASARGGSAGRAIVPSGGASADARQSDELVYDCVEAVRMLDGVRLHRLLQEGMLHFSRQALLENVVGPLMKRVGRGWAEGTLRIVHGHMAAVVVQSLLNTLLTACYRESAERACMLVATPSGQHCYLGALAVAITAQDHGWKTVMLGFDLPAEEIAAACTILDPQLIALSITCRMDDAFTNSELKRLTQLIDGRCPVVVGGRASHHYRGHMDSTGCTVCTTVKAMMRRLV